MEIIDAYKILLNKVPAYFIVDITGEIIPWSVYAQYLGGMDIKFPTVIIPGSFNPLHIAHRAIRDGINSPKEMTFFEMSINRFGKPLVTLDELADRLLQFIGYSPVIISNTSRFIGKIGLLMPEHLNLVFHVGIDTIISMRGDYGIAGIQGLNAKFVVNSRIIDGKLHTLLSEFGCTQLYNCVQSKTINSIEKMSMSSTKIRSMNTNSLFGKNT